MPDNQLRNVLFSPWAGLKLSPYARGNHFGLSLKSFNSLIGLWLLSLVNVLISFEDVELFKLSQAFGGLVESINTLT